MQTAQVTPKKPVAGYTSHLPRIIRKVAKQRKVKNIPMMYEDEAFIRAVLAQLVEEFDFDLRAINSELPVLSWIRVRTAHLGK